jgi:vitamin B12 transporter
MFKKTILILIIFPILANADIKLEKIITTATRIETLQKDVIADTSIITKEEIERSGNITLPQLLQKQSGVEIQNNGGQGKVSSVFLRGNDAESTIILLDGLRINTASSGLTTLENIPLSQIDRIEILRGPASSLYGADALGGVIQLFTKQGYKGFHPYMNVGHGKYSTNTGQIGFRGGNTDTKYSLNLSSADSEGFSALDTTAALKNDKDGYDNFTVSGSISHQINDIHHIAINLFRSETNNEYDDPFSTYPKTNKLILETFNTSLNSKFSEGWHSTINIGVSADEYRDHQKLNEDYINVPGRDKFETRQRHYSWQNNLDTALGKLTLLVDRLEQELVADAAYDDTERDNTGYMIGLSKNYGNHQTQFNIRTDDNSDYGTNTTGNLGYGYQITPKIKLVSTFGTAFHAPTFNELYYPGSSKNPNLLPEESTNIEFGLRYKDNENYASITTFQNKIDDYIVNDENFVPQNSNRAKIQGVTLEGACFIGNTLFKGTFSVQSAKDNTTNKYLIRRSKRYGSLLISRYINEWNIGSEFVGSGVRYNDVNNTKPMSGYIVTNFFANYEYNNNIKINMRLDNVMNKNYTLAKSGSVNYQTPGTSFFVNLIYEP